MTMPSSWLTELWAFSVMSSGVLTRDVRVVGQGLFDVGLAVGRVHSWGSVIRIAASSWEVTLAAKSGSART